jgi:hypothetical protein
MKNFTWQRAGKVSRMDFNKYKYITFAASLFAHFYLYLHTLREPRVSGALLYLNFIA